MNKVFRSAVLAVLLAEAAFGIAHYSCGVELAPAFLIVIGLAAVVATFVTVSVIVQIFFTAFFVEIAAIIAAIAAAFALAPFSSTPDVILVIDVAAAGAAAGLLVLAMKFVKGQEGLNIGRVLGVYFLEGATVWLVLAGPMVPLLAAITMLVGIGAIWAVSFLPTRLPFFSPI